MSTYEKERGSAIKRLLGVADAAVAVAEVTWLPPALIIRHPSEEPRVPAVNPSA